MCMTKQAILAGILHPLVEAMFWLFTNGKWSCYNLYPCLQNELPKLHAQKCIYPHSKPGQSCSNFASLLKECQEHLVTSHYMAKSKRITDRTSLLFVCEEKLLTEAEGHSKVSVKNRFSCLPGLLHSQFHNTLLHLSLETSFRNCTFAIFAKAI